MINTNNNPKKAFFDKINLRILMIQKQIYLATKKHKLFYVYQLQKYLINSNEAKFIAIKHVINRIIIFYTKYYTNQLYIRRIENYMLVNINFYFYKYLLLDKDLLTINYMLKNGLVYLSIFPVYKARLKVHALNYFIHKNFYQIYNFCCFYNNNHNFNYLNQFKFNFVTTVIKRLYLSQYISKIFIHCMYSSDYNLLLNLYYVDINKNTNLRSNKFKSTFINYNNLGDLISNFLFLDICWLFFRSKVKKNYIMHLRTMINFGTNIIYYKSVKICNQYNSISNDLKILLYQKIYKRLNTISYKLNFFKSLIIEYLQYYKQYIKFICCSLLKSFHEWINIFLYMYFYKKQKNRTLLLRSSAKTIIASNYYLNLSLYYLNITNFYTF